MGTHLNCIDLLMQFKCVPTTYAFIKKNRKKKNNNTKTLHKHNLIGHLLIDLVFKAYSYSTLCSWIHILLHVFPVILKNLNAQCDN